MPLNVPAAEVQGDRTRHMRCGLPGARCFYILDWGAICSGNSVTGVSGAAMLTQQP